MSSTEVAQQEAQTGAEQNQEQQQQDDQNKQLAQQSAHGLTPAPQPSQEDHNKSETKYRTSQQQEKADAAVKLDRREAGEQTNRSRSSSRRDRRKRIRKGVEDGKYMKTNSLEALEEADASGELQQMGMFERIGPDSTSMDGPVTYARAQRGEIPLRGSDPNQPVYAEKGQDNSVRLDYIGTSIWAVLMFDTEHVEGARWAEAHAGSELGTCLRTCAVVYGIATFVLIQYCSLGN